MASHHQYHHCHPATTTTSTICYCCYCCPNTTPSHHHPPVPDIHPLHHYPPPPQTNLCAHYPNGPNLNPLFTNQSHHHHHQQQQQPQYHPHTTDLDKERYFHQLHHDRQRELTYSHPVVSSLLRRIAALESSFRRSYSSHSHSHSLRDAAARTIQTHFRAFLVRRSRTLRKLKNLASIKSTLNILKSSVSENPNFDPQSVSRKALKLLFKLNSIQGAEPMIRDGKKSISRELTFFLDFIDDDGVTVKKSEISARLVKKNVTRKCGGLYNDQKRGNVGCSNLARNMRLENLVDRIDALSTKVPDEDDFEIPGISQHTKIANLGKRTDGVGAKVKKSVSFMENGYQVHRSRYGPVSVGDVDSGDESDSVGAMEELDDEIDKKAEEVGEISVKETEDDGLDKSQDGQYSESNDGEGGPVYERNEDGGFTFSAPLPVKMETRTDLMDKWKSLKIIQ